MKNLLYLVLLAILSWLLSCLFYGCLERENKISHERGVVIGRNFTDSYWNTYTTTEQYYNGKEYVCCIPKVHNDYVPAKYIVVFKCDHDKVFKINNSTIYAKLHEWDTVVIDYYNLLNSDGETKDYEFIDANKVVNKNW